MCITKDAITIIILFILTCVYSVLKDFYMVNLPEWPLCIVAILVYFIALGRVIHMINESF